MAERHPENQDPLDLVEALFVPGLVFLTLALRLWHVRHGLPDFLEVAAPLRVALTMRDPATGGVDWNPHHFIHPSFTIYLHFLVQQIVFGAGAALGAWGSYADYLMNFRVDPAPMVVAARLVGIACDALTVVAAYRLARRLHPGAGLLAGLLVACAPALLATSRSIVTVSVMTAASMWALERMLSSRHGDRGRMEAAAALVGIATGSEYAAVVLVAPLLVRAWRRDAPGGAWRALAGAVTALAIATVVFLLTTPFAVLDPVAFARDFGFQLARHAESFGDGLSQQRFAFQVADLARNYGGLALPLIAGSLGFVVSVARRPAGFALWLAFFGFAWMAALVQGPDQAVLALGGVLAAATLHASVSPFRRSVRRALLGMLLLFTAGPGLVAGTREAWSGSDTTQLEARRWCERALKSGEVLVEEPFGARLPSPHDLLAVEKLPEFRHASDEARRQFFDQRTFPVVTLPLLEPGAVSVRVTVPGRWPREVEVFPRTADLVPAFYDPRLYVGCDYVLTSGAVRDGYEADPRRAPEPCAFYRLLDATCELVARFAPQGAVQGPEIRIYRIGSRFRAAVEARGDFDPLWWTHRVPRGYRALVTRMLETPATRLTTAAAAVGILASPVSAEPVAGHGAQPTTAPEPARPSAADTTRVFDEAAPGGPALVVAAADSEAAWNPPSWVVSLVPVFDREVRPFVDGMMAALEGAGRNEEAARYALATLALHPEDEAACRIYSGGARAAGHLDEARLALERTLSMPRSRPPDPALRLEYAHVLEDMGDPGRARIELEALAAIRDSTNRAAAEARHVLGHGN